MCSVIPIHIGRTQNQSLGHLHYVMAPFFRCDLNGVLEQMKGDGGITVTPELWRFKCNYWNGCGRAAMEAFGQYDLI